MKGRRVSKKDCFIAGKDRRCSRQTIETCGQETQEDTGGEGGELKDSEKIEKNGKRAEEFEIGSRENARDVALKRRP